MRLDQSFRSYTQLLSSEFIVQLTNFITLPIILRYFVPEEYGKVALFQTIYGICLIFFGFMDSAKPRFGREEYINEGHFQKTYCSILYIKIPFIIIFGVLILLKSKWIIEFTGLPSEIIYFLLIVTILSIFQRDIEFINAQEKYGIVSLVRLISVFTRICTVLMLLFNIAKPYAMFLIIMAILTVALEAITVLVIIFKKITLPVLDLQWIKFILLFSLPFLIQAIGAQTFQHIDTIVIRTYLPLSDVGIYTVAYRLFNFAMIPLGIIMTMISPKMVSMYTNNETDNIKWFYSNISPQISFFMSQLYTVIILLAPFLPIFFGIQYEGAISPLVVLLISLSWVPYIYMMVPLFYSSKKVLPHNFSTIIVALINVKLDLALVPRVGIIGGAIGSTIAAFFSLLIHGFYFNKYFGVNVLKCLYLSFPGLLTGLSILLNANWFIISAVYLISTIIAWSLAIYVKMFNNESLLFFDRLGIPKIIGVPFSKFYETNLIK